MYLPVYCFRVAINALQLPVEAPAALQTQHPCHPLLHHIAGSACLFNKHSRAVVLLAKAGFLATVFYTTITAANCLAATCAEDAVAISAAFSLAGGLVGAMMGRKLVRVLAGILLPPPIYQVVGTEGVLSGDKGRAGVGPAARHL